MSLSLTPKSPREWPTVTVPDDSDSLLWSGEIRASLTKLADRTDWIRAYGLPVTVAGEYTVPFTPSGWADVTYVSFGGLTVGDRILVMGHFDRTAVRAVVDDTVAVSQIKQSSNIVFAATGGTTPIAFCGLFTAARNTTHTLRLQHQVGAGVIVRYGAVCEVFRVTT